MHLVFLTGVGKMEQSFDQRSGRHIFIPAVSGANNLEYETMVMAPVIFFIHRQVEIPKEFWSAELSAFLHGEKKQGRWSRGRPVSCGQLTFKNKSPPNSQTVCQKDVRVGGKSPNSSHAFLSSLYLARTEFKIDAWLTSYAVKEQRQMCKRQKKLFCQPTENTFPAELFSEHVLSPFSLHRSTSLKKTRIYLLIT